METLFFMRARWNTLLFTATAYSFRVFGDNVTITVGDNGISQVTSTIPNTPSGSTDTLSQSSEVSKTNKEPFSKQYNKISPDKIFADQAHSTDYSTRKSIQEPEKCILVETVYPISTEDEVHIKKSIENTGGYIEHAYRNVFNGLSLCNTRITDVEKALAERKNRIISKESNTQYSLAYRQINLPDNFYVVINNQHKIFNIPWLDKKVNGYVRNGYLLRQSGLFQWYRNRYLPLQSNYTGRGIRIEVLDGDIGAVHKEIEGRVSVLRNSAAEHPTPHATSVMTAAAGASTGLAKDSELVLHPVFKYGVAYLSEILHTLDTISVKERKIILLPFIGKKSEILDKSLKIFYDANIPVVVSAGNTGKSSCEYSPSRSKYTITVGSASARGVPEKWSNTGACTDVYAPGTATVGELSEKTLTIQYGEREGTSLSAAYTSGYIAVLMEVKNSSVYEIKTYLKQNGLSLVGIPSVGDSTITVPSDFTYANTAIDFLIALTVICVLVSSLSVCIRRKRNSNHFVQRKNRKTTTI